MDVISSVPVEMMYSEEDMDKAGFMRLNKVVLANSSQKVNQANCASPEDQPG